MPKVSFRMASASRESVFGEQTNTARKIHRSDHTEGRLTTAPSGCCLRKGTAIEAPMARYHCLRVHDRHRSAGDPVVGTDLAGIGAARLGSCRLSTDVIARHIHPAVLVIGTARPGHQPDAQLG